MKKNWNILCSELSVAICNGETERSFIKRVKAKTQLPYDENINTFLRVIYVINIGCAYYSVRYQQQIANIDSRPYWRYDSINDARTRPDHAALDGFVFKYDDPFWDTHYPPNGWGCRCNVIALTAGDIEREKLKVCKNSSDFVIALTANDTKESKLEVNTDNILDLPCNINWHFNLGKEFPIPSNRLFYKVKDFMFGKDFPLFGLNAEILKKDDDLFGWSLDQINDNLNFKF